MKNLGGTTAVSGQEPTRWKGRPKGHFALSATVVCCGLTFCDVRKHPRESGVLYGPNFRQSGAPYLNSSQPKPLSFKTKIIGPPD